MRSQGSKIVDCTSTKQSSKLSVKFRSSDASVKYNSHTLEGVILFSVHEIVRMLITNCFNFYCWHEVFVSDGWTQSYPSHLYGRLQLLRGQNLALP